MKKPLANRSLSSHPLLFPCRKVRLMFPESVIFFLRYSFHPAPDRSSILLPRVSFCGKCASVTPSHGIRNRLKEEKEERKAKTFLTCSPHVSPCLSSSKSRGASEPIANQYLSSIPTRTRGEWLTLDAGQFRAHMCLHQKTQHGEKSVSLFLCNLNIKNHTNLSVISSL